MAEAPHQVRDHCQGAHEAGGTRVECAWRARAETPALWHWHSRQVTSKRERGGEQQSVCVVLCVCGQMAYLVIFFSVPACVCGKESDRVVCERDRVAALTRARLELGLGYLNFGGLVCQKLTV